MTATVGREETVTIHGRQVAFRDYPGGGVPLLLLHGVGSTADSWEPAAAELAQSGTRVIVLDLPGHGRSSKESGDYSLGALASTLRDLMDHLDVPRAILVGHSLGGGIALQFSYQFPHRCAGLVLVASGGLGTEANFALRAATLPGAGVVMRVAINDSCGRPASDNRIRWGARRSCPKRQWRECRGYRSRASETPSLRHCEPLWISRVSACQPWRSCTCRAIDRC
jgi:pimeloyl-ACP methyl ester carboxylesterase